MNSHTGVFADLERFVRSHLGCAGMTGDAEAPSDRDYRFWVACCCGERFDRVTPEAAAADLLTSRLMSSPKLSIAAEQAPEIRQQDVSKAAGTFGGAR